MIISSVVMSVLQYGLSTYIVGLPHDDSNLYHWLLSAPSRKSCGIELVVYPGTMQKLYPPDQVDEALSALNSPGKDISKMSEIEKTAQIAVPIGKVWQALTVPDVISDWMSDEYVKVDLKIGGRYSFFGGETTGKFIEIETAENLKACRGVMIRLDFPI